MGITSKIRFVFKSSSPDKKEVSPVSTVNPKEVDVILTAAKERRSIYSLKPELPDGVTIEQIRDITLTILEETPSAFNSQPNKVLILTGEAHKQVWNKVVEAIPSESEKKTPQSAAEEAFGTVLFITDDKVTRDLQERYPAWSGMMSDFAVTSNGALQISTWTALSQLQGVGANLQHFNFMKEYLGDMIGENETIQSQLVFGTKTAGPGKKTYKDHKIPIISEL